MIPESYLSHALGEQRANHRYIARVPIGNNRNRYFYSIDEYRAFRNGGRKSLGDRLDAARSKAAKNVGDVSKTIASRNQAVRKKAEDATWNALSRINKSLNGRNTPKTINQVESTGNKSHSTKIFRDYIDTMTDPKKRSQQLQNERERNQSMFDQSRTGRVIADTKKQYNDMKNDVKKTWNEGVDDMKWAANGIKNLASDTKKGLSDSIKRPIDAGVEKNSAMKKQVDAMKKANLAMNTQTKYKGGYNIKPLTNLDVISTTAAKGAANVANRVNYETLKNTKEHMAEAKKQVDEGVKRSENYWSKKKDVEKDVADAYDEVSKKAKSTADKGKDFINGVFDKAKSKAKDTADDVVDAVKSKGREASSSASKKFEELGRQTRSNIEKSTKEAAEKSAQKLKATKADVEAGYQKISAAARKYGDEISDWPKDVQKEYYEWLSKYHELTGK